MIHPHPSKGSNGGEIARNFMTKVAYPEFVRASIVPFCFGAKYLRVPDKNGQPGGNGPIEFQSADAEKFWSEDDKLGIKRVVHKVRDRKSENLIDTIDFWSRDGGNKICVIWRMDGVYDGHNPEDWYTDSHGVTKTRPSVSEIKDGLHSWMDKIPAGRFVNEWGVKYGYEYDPKAEGRDDVACKSIAAVSEVYKEKFGKYPENYGKYPNDWVEPVKPEPDIPPVIIIDDEEKPESLPEFCTLWYHLKRLNFMAAWEHLMGKHK